MPSLRGFARCDGTKRLLSYLITAISGTLKEQINRITPSFPLTYS
ncbi:hypothetical protein ABN702_21340 [Bacillus haimaensis]